MYLSNITRVLLETSFSQLGVSDEYTRHEEMAIFYVTSVMKLKDKTVISLQLNSIS